MTYSFFLLRREVITCVSRANSGLTSDLSSSTKEDMVVVRSAVEAEGDDCDKWLEVALAYVLGGSVIFFSGKIGFFDFYFCMQNAGELDNIVRLFSGFKIDEEKGERTFGGFVKYVSDLSDLKKAMF
ncbi:hypothetical protein QTP88_023193 [Uroleucon formosanum]